MKEIEKKIALTVSSALISALPGVASATACMSNWIEWAAAGPSGSMIAGGMFFGTVASEDGGRTWSERSSVTDYALGQAAISGKSTYLSTRSGTYVSDDLGRNWQLLGMQSAIALDDRGRVYACNAEGRAVEVLDAQREWQQLPLLDKRQTVWETILRKDGKADSSETSYDINGRKTVRKGGDFVMDLSPRSPSCKKIVTAGRLLAVFSDEAIFFSKDRGKHWKGVLLEKVLKETASVNFDEAGMQLDAEGTLYIDRYVQDQRVVMRSRDGGANWEETPGTRGYSVIGAGGKGIYLVSAGEFRSSSPRTIYRQVRGGPLENILALDKFSGVSRIDGFYQSGGNGPALVTMRDALMVQDADGSWRTIQGQAMTTRPWSWCSPPPPPPQE